MSGGRPTKPIKSYPPADLGNLPQPPAPPGAAPAASPRAEAAPAAPARSEAEAAVLEFLDPAAVATEAEVKAIVERMKASLSFTATPTITPRISAPAPAGGGGASPARAAGGPGGATVRSASLRRGGGGNTITGPIHVHGVIDVASLHRGIQREADRKVREARNDALHDIGNDFS